MRCLNDKSAWLQSWCNKKQDKGEIRLWESKNYISWVLFIYHGSKNYIRSFQIYVLRLRNEVCLLIIEFRVSRNGVNEKTIKSRMNAKERKAKTKTKKSVRGGLAMPLWSKRTRYTTCSNEIPEKLKHSSVSNAKITKKKAPDVCRWILGRCPDLT